MQQLIGREQALLRERQEFLEYSNAMLTAALSRYAERTVESRQELLLEPLYDLATVRRRLEELAVESQLEVLSFSPTAANPEAARQASRPLDLSVLRRGVKMRTLYPDAVRSDPGAIRYAWELVAAGAAIRLVPSLPLRLIIVDREVAVVPLDPQGSTVGALLMRSAGVVQAMVALFESFWAGARALPGTDEAPVAEQCSAQELIVLRLLAGGAKDEAVAHHLGLSVRTLRRIIADLMIRAGASSRFELGAQAAARGWI
jgi:DNA-binding CsgD family transcriptional regulator